jgi:putative lipoic acid-binding regulatory protein
MGKNIINNNDHFEHNDAHNNNHNHNHNSEHNYNNNLNNYEIDKEIVYNKVKEYTNKSNIVELGDLKDNQKIEIDFKLPNYWLFKVIGENCENFTNKINEFLKDKKLKNEMSIIYSKNSKYCSFNFEIYVSDKEEIYKFYKELKSIKETKFCF